MTFKTNRGFPLTGGWKSCLNIWRALCAKTQRVVVRSSITHSQWSCGLWDKMVIYRRLSRFAALQLYYQEKNIKRNERKWIPYLPLKTFQVHFVNNLSGSTICTFSHLYFSSSEAALHNSFFRRTYLSLCSYPPAKHLLLRPDALLNLPRIWKRKKKTCRRKWVSGRGATRLRA